MEPFSSACRLCLWKGDKMIDVFKCNQKYSILDKIHKCLPIKFQKSDVTHVICNNCYYKLEIFAEFLTVCSRSDGILKRYIESQSLCSNEESAECPDLNVFTVLDSSDDGMTEDEDVDKKRLENSKASPKSTTKREIPRLTDNNEMPAANKNQVNSINVGQLSEKTGLSSEQSKPLLKLVKPKSVQMVPDQTINKVPQTVSVSEPAKLVSKPPLKVKKQVNEVQISGQEKQTAAQDKPLTAQLAAPDKQAATLEKRDSVQDKQAATLEKRDSVQDKQVTPQKKPAAAPDKQATVQNKQITAVEKLVSVQDKQVTPQKKQSAPQDKQVAAQNEQTSPEKAVTVQDKQVAPPKKQAVAQDKETTNEKQAPVQDKQISADKQAAVQVKQVPVQKKQVAVQDKQVTITEKQVAIQDKQVLPQKKQTTTQDKQVSQDKQVTIPDKQVTPQSKQIAAHDNEAIGKDKREGEVEKQPKSQWKEVHEKQLAEELKKLLEQEKAVAALINKSKPKIASSQTIRHSPRLYNEYTRPEPMVNPIPSTSSSIRKSDIWMKRLRFPRAGCLPKTNGNALNPLTDVGEILSDVVQCLPEPEDSPMDKMGNLSRKIPMIKLNRVNVCLICGSVFCSEDDFDRHCASSCSTRKRKQSPQGKEKFKVLKSTNARKRTRLSWVNERMTNLSPEKPESLTILESLGLMKKGQQSTVEQDVVGDLLLD